eukprot:2533190-Amphidinium_carterae.1
MQVTCCWAQQCCDPAALRVPFAFRCSCLTAGTPLTHASRCQAETTRTPNAKLKLSLCCTAALTNSMSVLMPL